MLMNTFDEINRKGGGASRVTVKLEFPHTVSGGWYACH